MQRLSGFVFMRYCGFIAVLFLFGVVECNGALQNDVNPMGGKYEMELEAGTVQGSIHFVGIPCAEFTPDAGCDGPLADYVVVIQSIENDNIIARVSSNNLGEFSIQIPPGSYFVDTQAGMMPQDTVRTTFTVYAGKLTPIELTVHTGIR